MNEGRGPTFDFDEVAERVRIPAGDVGHVVSTARRRTRRHRRVLSATMAVAVVSSIVAVDRMSSTPDEGLPVAAGDGVRRGTLGLTWQRFEPSSGLGMASGLTNRGPLYALSTAPGQREVTAQGRMNGVVWRSDDGVEWSAASTLGNDLFLSDLSVGDKRIYAVGTSPGEALPAGARARLTSSDLVVGWSDDQGRKWQKAALPIDLADARLTRWGSVTSTAVATGPRGVLAVAAFTADLDVPALLPAGVTAPRGWSTTDTGVDILGAVKAGACPEGLKPAEVTPSPGDQVGEVPPVWCADGKRGQPVAPQDAYEVKAHYSFAQLGVDGDVLRAVRRQPIAWWAEPGSTEFRRVELPEVGGVSGGLEVTAHENGFDVLAVTGDRFSGSNQKVALLQSNDGKTWQTLRPPAHSQWVAGLGRVGGRTAFVGGAETGAVLTVADSNGGWTTTALASLIDPALLEGRSVHASAVSFGAFGIALNATLVPAEDDRRKESTATVVHRILVSRDGATWDDFALDDILGEAKGSVNRIAVLADRVVVTASLPNPKGAVDTRRQVVFVGAAG